MAWFFDSKNRKKREIKSIVKPHANLEIYEVTYKDKCKTCGSYERETFNIAIDNDINKKKAISGYVEEVNRSYLNRAYVTLNKKGITKETMKLRFPWLNPKTLRHESIDTNRALDEMVKRCKK